MRPFLPTAAELMPYLERIEAARVYTNFGPLSTDFLDRLLAHQTQLEGGAFGIYGVLTSSATSGLELALSALDLPAGSRVAVPALTFPATATAVLRCGLIPWIVDVDPHSWLLTPEVLQKSLGGRQVSAVIPVAAFGMPQDATLWAKWSHDNGIPVVIDAAAAFDAQKTASGVSVVFSFHATKVLSSAEGGLVLTREATLADQLKAMSNFGIGLSRSSKSTNAKMSEYHAAVGLAHLKLLPSQKLARRELWRLYQKAFSRLPSGIVTLQRDTGLSIPSVVVVRVGSSDLRDELEIRCHAAAIQTRRWYQPLLQMQPMFALDNAVVETPVAAGLAETLIGLPFHLGMSSKDVNTVMEQFSFMT
jgi:dTDP-4-amino-4,6-dideoxygalactose transaminase